MTTPEVIMSRLIEKILKPYILSSFGEKFFSARVTPQVALRLLEFNSNNRPFKELNVEALRRDMELGGAWTDNREPVRFGLLPSGIPYLMDGQHRLTALSRCSCNTHVILTFHLDVPEQVASTIDIGAKRSPGDMLSRSGIENSALMAAMAARLMAFEAGSEMSGRKFSSTEKERYVLKNHDEMILANQRAGSLVGIVKPRSVVATALFIINRAASNSSHVDDFVTALREGERGTFAYRDWFQRKGEKETPERRIEVLCRCWNSFRAGETLTRIPIRAERPTVPDLRR
jgi:hypothetical protein